MIHGLYRWEKRRGRAKWRLRVWIPVVVVFPRQEVENITVLDMRTAANTEYEIYGQAVGISGYQGDLTMTSLDSVTS